MTKTLAVIPARGGSQELRRKNLLPDANGIPLVLASARAARDAGCVVYISTDDAEIKSLATIDGFYVHDRGPELADVPVDEVVKAVADWYDSIVPSQKNPAVLLVQPTVQPMTADILKWFLSAATGKSPIFPELGTQPIALGVEDRHLIWHRDKLLMDRVERQACRAWPIREMGVRWWPAGAVPSRNQPQAVIAAPHHLVDIDTVADYAQIRKRLTIQWHVRASKQYGTGHLSRALTLAEGLQHHDIRFVTTGDTESWVDDLLRDRGWIVDGGESDVQVFDVLDTDWPEVAGANFVTFEDQGAGAGYATAIINAMYDAPVAGGGISSYDVYMGSKYAVLRPEFLIGDYQVKSGLDSRYDPDLYSVMILFGGTDPSGLAALAVNALTGADLAFTEFGPQDQVSVAAEMHKHDLLITSGGRTVFEAAAVGIPTIVMCQNQRELTHTHLGVGNINLNLGRLVTAEQLRHVVTETLGDYEMRRDMSATAKASIDGYGADRVRRIIEHVGLYGEKP